MCGGLLGSLASKSGPVLSGGVSAGGGNGGLAIAWAVGSTAIRGNDGSLTNTGNGRTEAG